MSYPAEDAIAAFRRTPRGAGSSEGTRQALRDGLHAAGLLDDLHTLSVRVRHDDVVIPDEDQHEIAT